VTEIRLKRIVPLATPDAEVCVDGVCEIPVPSGSNSGEAAYRDPATAEESGR
jgi:hypothetical protein